MVSPTLLFVCLLGAVCARDFRQEFEDWKLVHSKTYTTNENELRFSNFLASIKRIEERNRRVQEIGEGATYGLNKFSDLSRGEWMTTYLSKVPQTPKTAVAPVDVAAVPSVLDWRTSGVVSAVKNQEQCGSCWAFSATETIESAWMMAKGIKNTTFAPLAPQQIVDCDTSDDGCGGGNPYTAYEYVISAGGLDKQSAYPYTGVDGSCKFVPGAVGATITNWKYACDEDDETTLKTNVATAGPLSICVDAQNWQDYTSGVMTAWECAWINLLDHCVQAVGYNMDASTPYWLVRNSWGTDWGEAGYIKLQYGDNTCGLTNEATYVVVQ